MSNQDWDKFGEQIRRTVQDAIDSQDYHKLNQTITNTINDAVGGIKNTFQSAGPKGTTWQQTRDKQGNVVREEQRRPVQQPPALYARTTSTKLAGILFCVFGGVFGITAVILFILCLIGAIVLFHFSPGIVAGMVISAIAAVGCGIMTGKGVSLLGRVKRFGTYVKLLQQNGYCEMKVLQDRTRKSLRYLKKDLERMRRKGWFRQGHFDKEMTCFMASDQIFNEYKLLMNQRLEIEAEKAREEELREAEFAKIDPQIQQLLKEGNEYIQKIHECNEAIPGEEISAKIAKMEALVDRIFDRIEQDPGAVSNIQRLMNYYLPTTVKLLNAYAELDQQPVQGENILSSKSEIEKTLDTLNVAFEKLLDDMFQRTAWDVSSDISVLNTMLAQEGLTEDGIRKL